MMADGATARVKHVPVRSMLGESWQRWSPLGQMPAWMKGEARLPFYLSVDEDDHHVTLHSFLDEIDYFNRFMAGVDIKTIPAVFLQRPGDSRVPASLLDEELKSLIFVYDGALSDALSHFLNRLRLAGCLVMPLSVDAMRAAIIERSAGQLYRELSARYFRPHNAFIQHGSLNDRAMFFGRGPLLARLGAATASIVTGLRKSGKSSLLRMARQHQAELPWCWVDLQRFDPHQEDWPALLFAEIIRAVDAWGQLASPPDAWPVERVASVRTASALADAMQSRLECMRSNGCKSPRVVLVLDELERVFPRTSEPLVNQRWVRAAGALRQAAETGERWLTILAADLRPTATRRNILPSGETNPFYQFFRELPLPLLTREQSREMIEGIGKIMGVCEISPAFHERLHAITAGHPYLTRLIAGRCYERVPDSARLTEADLDRGLDEMDERWELGSFFEQNLWNFATEAERALLCWVDQAGQPAGRRPPPELKMRRSEWMTARAALTDQGILKDGQIVLGGFREWLREEFSGAA